MTLDELKQIEQQARDAGYKRSQAQEAARKLAGLRTSETPVCTKDLIQRMASYGWGSDTARHAFLTVLDECQSDMLRIAEMRLEALARAMSQRERMLRAQLAEFLGEPCVPAAREL